jgi:hypothetical protein
MDRKFRSGKDPHLCGNRKKRRQVVQPLAGKKPEQSSDFGANYHQSEHCVKEDAYRRRHLVSSPFFSPLTCGEKQDERHF